MPLCPAAKKVFFNECYRSTEFYDDEEGEFRNGPLMPYTLSFSCAVEATPGRVVVSGGSSQV